MTTCENTQKHCANCGVELQKINMWSGHKDGKTNCRLCCETFDIAEWHDNYVCAEGLKNETR